MPSRRLEKRILQHVTFVDVPAAKDAIWPVGSIFLTIAAGDPADLLGFGTWSNVATGQMLVGYDSGDSDFNAAEKTGGEKAHTLTTAELPAHTHTYDQPDSAVAATAVGTDTMVPSVSSAQDSGSTGSGDAHNNLPPFYTVYVWKRTA